MSVTRDNSCRLVEKQINKIIPKNIKRNLVEYDSNPFERKIEDKISKFNKTKKEKEMDMFFDRESKIDNLLLSMEKNNTNVKNNHMSNKSKMKNNLRTSSAVNLRKNNLNDSFQFKDPSLINSPSQLDFNNEKEDEYKSNNKKFVDYSKKDLEKAKKKREERLKEFDCSPIKNTVNDRKDSNSIMNNSHISQNKQGKVLIKPKPKVSSPHWPLRTLPPPPCRVVYCTFYI